MRRAMITLLCGFCLAAGLAAAAPAARAAEATCADALHTLGLFRGDGAGLAAERTLRRDEAAVMLVRLLGGEAAALEQKHESPFTDLDAWFAPYAGWLWQNGLTRGVADDAFAPAMTADARQYFTFLLRALGYTDGADFEYAAVEEFLSGTGTFPPFGENMTLWYIRMDEFTRSQCAEATVAALGWLVRGEERTLGDALADRGVFTRAELVAALRPLADWIFLAEDGRLYHSTNWDIPLPVLGVSAEVYINRAEHVGGDWVAIDAEGTAWMVDGATLGRKCRLSASRVSLVDSQPHGGFYYFYEFPGGSGTARNVLRWNGAEGVETIYQGENVFFFDRPNGAEYIMLARSVNGWGYYDIIDLETGLFCTPSYANGTMYLATDARHTEDGKPDGAYALITFRWGEQVRYEVFLGDRCLAVFGEMDPADCLRAENGPSIRPLRAMLEAGEGFFVVDGGLLLCFSSDASLEEPLLARVGDFAGPVQAAWAEGETVYVLTGPGGGARGFYAVEEDGARLLLDESILAPLFITDLVPLDVEGRVALCRRDPIGMEHYDEYYYCYNAATERIEVVGFRPGRWYGDMREEIARYEAEMRAAVDALYSGQGHV